MYTLKCGITKLMLAAAVPLLLTLAACGGGAAGGAAGPAADQVDPPDSQLIALNAKGDAPLDVNLMIHSRMKSHTGARCHVIWGFGKVPIQQVPELEYQVRVKWCSDS